MYILGPYLFIGYLGTFYVIYIVSSSLQNHFF